MYTIVQTASVKKSLRKLKKSGSFDMEKFEKIVIALALQQGLPVSCRDHALQGDLETFRECHIEYDLLLQYRIRLDIGVLDLVKIGTHDELFG